MCGQFSSQVGAEWDFLRGIPGWTPFTGECWRWLHWSAWSSVWCKFPPLASRSPSVIFLHRSTLVPRRECSARLLGGRGPSKLSAITSNLLSERMLSSKNDSIVPLSVWKNIYGKWCCKWKMEINVGKSGVIHFRDKKRIKRCREVFRIGGEVIQMVAECKYLGVIIDEPLKGDRMMESVMENSRRALYGVNRLIRSLGNVGWETFTKLYMSYVRSSMLYAAEVWGLLCKNEYKLEKVQRAAIRSRLGVHSKFPLLGLELEAGWMPVRWEVKSRAIKYYIKVSRNEKLKLLNRVMAWANEGVGWMEGEGGLLGCMGWCSQGSLAEIIEGVSLSQMNKMLEACAWRKLQEEWREGCSRSQKLRYWGVLVGNIAFAEWKLGGAVRVRSKDQRKLMGELRCGCAKLEVETGRWKGIAREDRICSLCKEDMGDESHFLTFCEAIKEERLDLEQFLNYEDENFDSNVVMRRLQEKPIARIVMNMWNRRVELL